MKKISINYSEIHLSSTEEEDFTETQGLEEEFDSENLGKW